MGKYGLDWNGLGANCIGDYRFGFNGMEQDAEIKGQGLDYNTEYRQYDPRVGRWFSPDLVVKPFESPYAGFANNPILYTDASGLNPHNNGAISQAIDKADRWLGSLVGRSRLFGFYGSNRRLDRVSDGHEGTLAHTESGNRTNIDSPRVSSSQDFIDIENGNIDRPPFGYTSTGFDDLEASVADALAAQGTIKPAQINYAVMDVVIEYDAYEGSPEQQFFLNGSIQNDKENPAQGAWFPDLNDPGRFKFSVDVGMSDSPYFVTSNIDKASLAAIGTDKFGVSTATNVNYRMTYAQVPVWRVATKKEQKLIDSGKYGSPSMATSTPGVDAVIGGWQMAPPNQPGAKPLWQHSARYIIKYTFGGSNGVDLSYGENRSLRTHNR